MPYQWPKYPVGVGLGGTVDVKIQGKGLFFVRVVFPEATTLRSFIHFFTFKGLSWYGGTGLYGKGTGGSIRHRFCTVDANGIPDLATPMADETVGAQAAVTRSRTKFGTSGSVDFLHFACDDIELEEGTMYAACVSNADASPLNNFFSIEAVASRPMAVAQNGNYTDPDPATAPDSLLGLDHRIVCGWTPDWTNPAAYASYGTNAPSGWRFGQGVGGPNSYTPNGGSGYGPYDGTGGGSQAIRLPAFGWEKSDGTRKIGQPYNAYFSEAGAKTITLPAATVAGTITHVGGYTEGNVGQCTVTNVTKSTSTTGTPANGAGLREAAVATQLAVAVGDVIRIANAGSVEQCQNDPQVSPVFGSKPDGTTTTSAGNDRAQLFVVPWPLHAQSGTPIPAEPDRALSQTASASTVEVIAAGGPYTADLAVDGNSNTRWASAIGEPQWWKVDLGANYLVDRVDINWEGAYASSYKIMVSTDNTSFTQAAAVTATNFGPRSTTFTPINARYVRIDCETRASIYGFSFYSVQVFGDAVSGGTPLSWSHGAETADSPDPTVVGTVTEQGTVKNSGSFAFQFAATGAVYAATPPAVITPADITGAGKTAYYVAANGSNSNNGTSTGTPWQTVAKVTASALTAGDGVFFRGGDTFSDSDLNPPSSGTLANRIVYGSYGTGRATLSAGAWVPGGRSYITFDNLISKNVLGQASGTAKTKIRVQNCKLGGFGAQYGHECGSTGDSFWEFVNNEITDTWDSGLIHWGTDFLVELCTIHNVGTTASGASYDMHGIYSKSPRFVCRNNQFYDIKDTGGQAISTRMRGALIEGNVVTDAHMGVGFWNDDSTAIGASRVSTIRNNRFNRVQRGVFVSSTGNTQTGMPETWHIYNNTIVVKAYPGAPSTYKTGIEINNDNQSPKATELAVTNNIVVMDSSVTSNYDHLVIRDSPSYASLTEGDNLFYGGTLHLNRMGTVYTTVASWASATGQGVGDITSDPLLAADLSLGAGSPAIDAGRTTVAPSVTFSANTDGQPLHYAGTGPDMGAVETGASAGPRYLSRSVTTALGTTHWMRMHFQIGAAPSATMKMMGADSTAGTSPFTARMSTGRTVRLYNRDNVAVGAASSAVSTGSFHCLEASVMVPAAGLGQVAMWLDDVEVQAPLDATTGNVAISSFWWGVNGSETIAGYFGDDLAVSSVARIGPVGGSADTTPPNTVIESGPAPSTTADFADFVVSATEIGCTFQYKLDAGAYTTVPSVPSFRLTGISVGAHTVLVRATDPAGNVDGSPASHSWTRTASVAEPNTTISSGPPNPSPRTDATFDFSADIPTQKFEGRRDSGAWVTVVSPHTITALSDGPHVFEIRATSSAGVLETTPATHPWTVSTPLALGLSDYAEKEVVDWVRGRKALAQKTVYVGLFVSAPTDAGGSEPTDPAYARKATVAADWAAATATSGVNAATIAFANPSAVYTPVAWGLWDAATGGNMLFSALLTDPQPTATGQALEFPAGALIIRAY